MPLLLTPLMFLLSACGKDGSPAVANDVAPTNLTISATATTDNSGNVAFSATATDAVGYDFNFGDGVVKSVPGGTITYQYVSGGTYNVTVTAKSSSGLTASKAVDVTVIKALALVWSDEFNTNGAPDATKWGYDIGTGSNGWGNNELEYYTNRSDNSFVSNGTLKIVAKRENYLGSSFTSGRLLSKDKYAFKYGRVEASAKLPPGVGTWPAIWMLGSNISTAGWPACGEIDIMEHRGMELNKIFGTLHYPGRSGGNADGNTRLITDATTAFHKYSLDWSATSVKIYVDDVLLHTVPNNAGIPFNQDFFFILNVAIGGSFAGAVDPLLTTATMEIDYIRVYK